MRRLEQLRVRGSSEESFLGLLSSSTVSPVQLGDLYSLGARTTSACFEGPRQIEETHRHEVGNGIRALAGRCSVCSRKGKH